MKKVLTIFIIVSGIALTRCTNTTLDMNNAAKWQILAGSTGIGFWAYGNDLDNPDAMLVFIRASSISRVEYWEGQELIRSAEWLHCTEDTIIYRAPNGQVISQTYVIINNGLWIDESPGIIWGGVFWRRERPSWWSWEIANPLPNLSGPSRNLTGGDGIGFWGAGTPSNPEYVWVFINTEFVSRVEFWENRQLIGWGHWIDADRDTITYRRYDHLNAATQRYIIQDNLWIRLTEHFAAIVWGGPWRRFDRPEWWNMEER